MVADGHDPDRTPWTSVLPELLARGSARVVDGVIVGAAAGIVSWAVSADPLDPLALALVAAAHLAYFLGFETRRGATPGKRLAGLVVRGPGGAPPDLAASLERNLWLVLLPFGVVGALGVPVALAVTIVVNRGPGVHDLWARTRVAPTP